MSAAPPLPSPVRVWARRVAAVLAGIALMILVPQTGPVWRRILGVGWAAIGLVAGIRIWRGRSGPGRWEVWWMHSAAVAGVVALTLMHLPVGGLLCRPLLVEPAPGQADAIVVLTAGCGEGGQPSFASYQRVLHGVALWRAGRAPRLVFSASDFSWRGTGDRDAIASLAAQLQVPAEAFAILHEGHLTTRTEARQISRYLLDRGWRRILLVTNGPHILRAVRAFAATGLEVLPAPVQTAATIMDATETDLGLTTYAVHEWLGLGWYWLRGDLASSPVPIGPSCP
ncbi:MAG: YdcF family protein [Candidatus Riflebacteria bacterium]|nr:YdcF family protein [Candidatus Riflebacteria bacterium]